VPAVVFKSYMDWTIDFFDDKIEKLTGYKKEDFDSRRIKWSDLIFKGDILTTRSINFDAFQAAAYRTCFSRKYLCTTWGCI